VVGPQAIANEARWRSDEAVRRLREESAQRIEQRNRWRAFSSWCALATLASGISLVALDARDAAVQAGERGRAEAACARLARREMEIQVAMNNRLAGMLDADEKQRTRVRAGEHLATARRIAREDGCEAAVGPMTPPRETWWSGWQSREPLYDP